MKTNDEWQTQYHGANDDEYQTYLSAADLATGLWIDGTPVKSYDEWLNS